jgi:hypothetical protein
MARIERLLFDEWLEERRKVARISWKWGPTQATGAAV